MNTAHITSSRSSDAAGLSVSSSRGRLASGLRLLWRGAFEFEDGAVLDGIAFISHLSFPAPVSSSKHLYGYPFPRTGPVASTSAFSRSENAFAPSHLTTASVAPMSPSTNPLAASTVTTAAVNNPALESKLKPKRAVLFSSRPETGSSSRSPTSSPGFAETSPSLFTLSPSIDVEISLALESLKGRPSISFRKTVRIGGDAESWDSPEGTIEGEGGVRLYTDPKCPLVLNFIRRQLLSKEPIVDARGRTTVGLLVSLGDESVDSSSFVIYGRAPSSLQSSPSLTSSPLFSTLPQLLTLHVARWNSTPPAPTPPPPRPDDPAPRRPPPVSLAMGLSLKGRPSTSRSGGIPILSGSLLPSSLAPSSKRSLAPTTTSENASGSVSVTKKPKLAPVASFGGKPSSVFSRSKALSPAGEEEEEETQTEEEVSGSGDVDMEGKDMGSMPLVDMPDRARPPMMEAKPARPGILASEAVLATGSAHKKMGSQEADNKAIIKQVAMSCLTEKGLPKDDPQFKEVWNWVVRGTAFAFREIIALEPLPVFQLSHIVFSHIDLYLPSSAVAAA